MRTPEYDAARALRFGGYPARPSTCGPARRGVPLPFAHLAAHSHFPLNLLG